MIGLNTTNIESYEIFLKDVPEGFTCFDSYGEGLVLGGNNFGRVYAYYRGEYSLLFDTDDEKVSSVLNIDSSTNLAAIGNRIYLIHCGEYNEIVTEETQTDVKETDISVKSNKNIVVTYPNEKERLEIGQDINIQWSSTKSINDAVKIELWKNGRFSQTIISNTSNDGSYIWTIPFSIELGSDYKIYIEWLSAGAVAESDKDLSDNSFSILSEIVTTTTTTTNILLQGEPIVTACRGIPILELPKHETIIKMENDPYYGGILVATSEGRILSCSEKIINAYCTGNRSVWVDVKGGKGFSSSSESNVLYALHNKIAEINDSKEIESWKFAKEASAIKVENITGIFTGPIVYVKEDLGIWKQLVWTETKPTDTEIIISIRSAETESALKNSVWLISFRSESDELGIITRDLTGYNLRGKYLQVKVEMKTEKSETAPSIANIIVTHSTKQASYFYTTKFSLENDANLKSGLLVANITQPTNTEVKFGVNNEDSNDWSDYKIVNPNELFELDNWENIKIGIKLIPAGANIATVGEFAIMAGAEKLKVLN